MKVIRYVTGQGRIGRIICDNQQEPAIIRTLLHHTDINRKFGVKSEEMKAFRTGTHN